ncbi:hypothetical protein Tco_0830575 [Tanacetum coccineum]
MYACVSRYLKHVNARTKKPNVVPISASKPKRKANKSVATPHKKTVASDTTIQKSKSYYKKLSSLGLHQMMSDHNSSDLAPQRQMVSAENNTSGPNSDVQDTARTRQVQSGSKVVPLAGKQLIMKRVAELLFHHQIAM